MATRIVHELYAGISTGWKQVLCCSEARPSPCQDERANEADDSLRNKGLVQQSFRRGRGVGVRLGTAQQEMRT